MSGHKSAYKSTQPIAALRLDVQLSANAKTCRKMLLGTQCLKNLKQHREHILSVSFEFYLIK
jgi:hypothetical protein